MTPYTRGLHELADGVFAYLVPDGGWGLSNAGLVAGSRESLLVDTLFDLPLTREMLAAMRSVTDASPIRTVVNSHGDGDHWWGNELLPADARIYATTAAIDEMRHALPAEIPAALANPALPPDVREFVDYAFGAFEFGGITPRPAEHAIDGVQHLRVGGRAVTVIPVAPAHTTGDAIVHVPDAGVVFAADVAFIGETPITWQPALASWAAACDVVLALSPRVVVPGHGPVSDADGIRTVQRYVRHVLAEAAPRAAAGMTAVEAAYDIPLGEFGELANADRIIVNVDRAYTELDPSRPLTDRVALFGEMARHRRAFPAASR